MLGVVDEKNQNGDGGSGNRNAHNEFQTQGPGTEGTESPEGEKAGVLAGADDLFGSAVAHDSQPPLVAGNNESAATIGEYEQVQAANSNANAQASNATATMSMAPENPDNPENEKAPPHM